MAKRLRRPNRAGNYWVRVGFSAYALLLLTGWTLPFSYKTYPEVEDPGQKLLHVIIERNGEPQSVPAGETLKVLRGDTIKIERAVLADRQTHPKVLNLLGYNNPRNYRGQDQGVDISTLGGFTPRWAVDEGQATFAIVALTDKKVHGSVFLELVMPSLKYADVVVNGKLRAMRDGELLVLDSEDKIRVQEIRTDVPENEGVDFHIVVSGDQKLKKKHFREASAYEIRFARSGLVFAKIPLLIENM